MSSEGHTPAGDAISKARENIRLIRLWRAGRSCDTLKAYVLSRYAIERAFIALDAAVKDIPDILIDAHHIPAGMITGFRNVLAHSYEDILDERVILTIKDDLPALDALLAGMQSAE